MSPEVLEEIDEAKTLDDLEKENRIYRRAVQVLIEKDRLVQKYWEKAWKIAEIEEQL